MYQLYIDVLTKPREVFAAQKASASTGGAAKNFAIAGLLAGIVGTIVLAATGLFMFDAMGAVTGIVGQIILAVIVGFIGAGIVHVIAKLLGGTGTFTQLAYLASIYTVPIALLGNVPIIGLLAGLYAIYLAYLNIMEVEALSSGKAILTILIPIVIIGGLLLVAAAAIIAALVAVGIGPYM